MPTAWIFPANVFVRTANTTAAALMTAFIANVHANIFPFVNGGWTKNGTNFIRAFRHLEDEWQSSPRLPVSPNDDCGAANTFEWMVVGQKLKKKMAAYCF